ncbi:MAG: CHASE domain-containing protein [Pseudomonadota bacterium]|nr:CHASE domain-containing protein [Pseudomonadota bacterium]
MSWPTAFALTVATYALLGLASLPLAIPPGYATPLFPAAGVALASVLIFGRGMLAAVVLGSLGMNTVVAWVQHRHGYAAAAVCGAVALGAALQAQVGAALVRRYVARPLTLSAPREIGAFVVSALVSCLVHTGIANTVLWLHGDLPTSELALSLSTWWIGDLFGVIIATPIALAFVGRPAQAWRLRRLSVGLTMALVTALLAMGIRQVVQWNEDRIQTAFDNDAANAIRALKSQLREAPEALEAMHGLFMSVDDVSPLDMQLATRAWLAPGWLQAIAWSQRVARVDVPSFEARARAQPGQETYRVFDRTGPTAARSAPEEDAVALRYIEPRATNAGAVGLNLMSIAAPRAAIEATRRTGQPAATAGFRLAQTPVREDQLGVVLYQAIYVPRVPAPDQRSDAMRGVVSVVLGMQDQLRALDSEVPAYLALCLLDVTPGTAPVRLGGPAGCEHGQSALQRMSELPYFGRLWQVHVTVAPGREPHMHSADVWLFTLVGLLSTSMLGAFLLTVTGRTQRIESAVLERTAALQAEVREREVAEAALRESEQRFRNILDNVPIGVIYTDLEGRVRQANPRFCELTGYAIDELLRMDRASYTHPDDVPQDDALMGQLVRGEIPMFRRHMRYIARGGTTVWVQATVSLLRDAQGRPRSVVGVVEDITDDLRLEKAERAREAAEASNRAKSEFLSRMSHELRTPLNAMLGFAQLLELDTRHPLTDTQRPWVSQIEQAGWHLLEMINDVLDLSRIESGNLRLQIQTLALDDLLDAALAMLAGDAAQRGITITRDPVPASATLQGDPTRVKQILTNLLSNAIKYNVDGGRVHVGTRLRGPEAVEVSVTDTGLGMTPAQLAELFQPFNRLGRERSGTQGTGIGLVISQRLAELMGGSLHARSVVHQGATFILTLARTADPDTVPSDLDALPRDPAAYHRRLVHYVEDNETNVEVMRGVLARRPQVELQVSVTGLDGLAAIRARLPDLVLLDMHLPDIDGMELLRHLKSDPHTGDVPIVVVSADALTQQIDAAFAAGCTHYLTKPVNVAELLKVVDDLLEQVDTHFA